MQDTNYIIHNVCSVLQIPIASLYITPSPSWFVQLPHESVQSYVPAWNW